MKRVIRSLIFFVGLLSAISIVRPAKVGAASVYQEPWSYSSQGTGDYYAIYGYFINETQEVLNLINQIRYEACVEGVPDPRNSSRKLTVADYVPLKWSNELERVARDRAVEASVSTHHLRLNGASIWTLSYNGVKSSAEDLAWNPSSSMEMGIKQFYEEKSIWLSFCAGTGTGVYGHYTSMINPRYNYVGIGDFYTQETYYNNSLAMELTYSSAPLDETMFPGTDYIFQKVQVSDDNIRERRIEVEEKLYSGKSVAIRPVIDVMYGSVRPIGSITYTSSDNSVATVTSNGILSGIKAGTTTISLYVNGSFYAATSVTVFCSHEYVYSSEQESDGMIKGTCKLCGETCKTAKPTDFRVAWKFPDGDIYLGDISRFAQEPGESVECSIYRMNCIDALKELRISSSNPDILSFESDTISKDKPCSAIVKGRGTVTVIIWATYNPSLRQVLQLQIGKNVDMSEVRVGVAAGGTEDNYSIEVTYNGCLLEENKDYYCDFYQNSSRDTIIISGIGMFSGLINRYYVHDKAVQLEEERYICTGKPIEPDLDSFYLWDVTKNKDYTITYTNNVEPGVGIATIHFIGEHIGSFTRTFTIEPSKPSISSVTASKKGLTVKWKHNQKCTGYKIYRRTGTGSYKKIATVDANTLSYQDTKATKNGCKYSYKIVSFHKLSGSTSYSSKSNSVTAYYLSGIKWNKLTNASSRKAKLSWKKNTKVSGYQVKYVKGNTKKTITLGAKSLSTTIKSLKKGSTYTFYIRGYYSADKKKYYSAWSDGKKLKIRK